MDKASRVMVRGPSGTIVPDRYFTKMMFTLQYNQAAIAASLDINETLLNSVIKIDVASATLNALGVQEISNFYDKFRVWASTATFQFVSNVADTFTVTLVPTIGGQSVATSREALEQPYSKYRIVGQGAGSSVTTLKSHMSVKKLFGYTNINQEDDFTGNLVSSPAIPVNPAYWVTTVKSNTGTNFTAGCYQWTLRVTYYVEFYDRILLAPT